MGDKSIIQGIFVNSFLNSMIIQKVQKSSEFHQAVFDQESPQKQ